MAVTYSRDKTIALYNHSLQNGWFSIAYGFHHMLHRGDHPGLWLNLGQLHQQTQWVSWLFDQNCSICFDSFEGNNPFFVTCGHPFHQTCIKRWLTNHQTCPNCASVCNLGGIIDPYEIILY